MHSRWSTLEWGTGSATSPVPQLAGLGRPFFFSPCDPRMTNFTRALLLGSRYRLTLGLIVASSLLVAVFWGANLATVYPIVEVVFQNRSLRDWIDDSIEDTEKELEKIRAEQATLTRLAENVPLTADQRRRQSYWRAQNSSEQKALARAQRIRPWVHAYLPDKPFPTLWVVVGLLMVGTLFKGVFLIANVLLVDQITQLAAFDLRKLLYRRTLRLSLASFGEERTSKLLSHFTHDLEALSIGIKTVFGRAIREPLKIIACLTGAAIVSWRLLLFCLIVTPIAMYLINLLGKSVKRANRRAMDKMADLYGHLSESLSGIQAVKAFTMERSERRMFHHSAKDYMRKQLRIAFYDSLTKPSTELMSMGVVCLAILAGGYLVLNEETHLMGLRLCNRPLTFGALMVFFALLAGVSDPFRKLAEIYNSIQRSVAAADRLYQLIDRVPEVRSPAEPVDLTVPLRNIRLDKVCFEYVPNCPVLQDVSVKISAGETLAIVGPNGCGKSSLASLIPRFYDPTSGRVLWNDLDLRDVRPQQIRERCGVVTQHTLLFDDTVLNNIRYGSPNATDEEVINAAEQAHAHRFIEHKLADGYNTVIGSSGKLLSGGQRQRLALARAILRDPDVLILDEATSQIDVESEHLIRQVLSEFVRNRTALMITHRMETLSLADRILVIGAGRVVDLGTHDELIGRCEFYQRLHQIEFRTSA